MSVEHIVREVARDRNPELIRIELDPDVSLGELVRALSASGLLISTLHGGRQRIHRAPRDAA